MQVGNIKARCDACFLMVIWGCWHMCLTALHAPLMTYLVEAACRF